MKEKLIRTEKQYVLQNEHGIVIATSYEDGKLSLNNCQAIDFGYNFDVYDEAIGYASMKGHPDPAGFSDEQVGLLHGYIDGFQKALEILGDKKFSDIDVKRAMRMIFDWSEGEDDHSECTSLNELWDKYFESAQQAEWDVEIIKEYVGECKGNNNDGCFQDSPGHDCGCYEYKPKFDDKGCLILRRI
jgi:hypothetical protein